MRALALAANRVGRGEAIEAPQAPFDEARAIGSALAEASVELKRRGELLARDKEYLEAEIASRTADLTRETARTSEVEEQLRQSQKMEALGQLAGGVAHDFNNMLAVIVASLQLIKRRLTGPGNEKLDRHITAALSAADRAAALTRRLLAFSRQQPLEPAVIDVNDVIRDLTDILRGTLGGGMALETRLGPGLWPVNIDPRQFELAIINLAVNARDAMENGGRLVIETRNDNTPPASVVVTITDTGSGMESEILARAFEPFFTTKPVGKGTGLGLSQVQGFTQQSGGQLKITSAPGEGTMVALSFPRHEGEGALRDERSRDTAAAPRAHAGEQVLVVEDEAHARALIVEALGELGYATLEAADGESALAQIRTASRIDLLLTDVVMPGQSGRDLARSAKALRPDLAVLYMTGFVRSAVLNDLEESWELGVLRKPFTFEDFAGTLRQTLDRRQG
jgi:signal transduction histidine kinase/CheY-like chemotaxis protein